MDAKRLKPSFFILNMIKPAHRTPKILALGCTCIQGVVGLGQFLSLSVHNYCGTDYNMLIISVCDTKELLEYLKGVFAKNERGLG